MRLMLVPRAAPSQAMALLAPLIALAATLVLGAGLMAALGLPPLETLRTFFLDPFTNELQRAEVVVKAIPLALIGAGLAVCFRANVWNIGAAGQYTMGAIAASWVALSYPEAEGPVWILAFLAAGLAGGALWAAVPALLKARFNASEILVSLMLAYVAADILEWLTHGPWRDPRSFGPQSRDFAEAFTLGPVIEGTRIHAGLWIALALAASLALMMARGVAGFRLRVIGAAPRAGAFAGFHPSGAVWTGLLLSGALAGLAGAMEVSANLGQIQDQIGADYGFTAIIVAFLGRLNPLGVLPAAALLAATYIGRDAAQIALGFPLSAAMVFQGLLLIALLAADTLIRFRIALRPRMTQPRSGGEA